MGVNSSRLGGYGDELPAALAAVPASVAAALPAALSLLTFPLGTETGIGAASIGTVTAAEYGDGVMHKTVLTLTDVPQTVVNGTEYQGTKIYDFPVGRILVFGVTASLQQKTTSIILNTLNGSSTGAVSLGSVVASNTTLSSTMVDLLPSTAFTSSATINVAGTAVTAALAASAQFASPLDMYLNSAFATTGDVDADATQTWTGTITVSWMNLG